MHLLVVTLCYQRVLLTQITSLSDNNYPGNCGPIGIPVLRHFFRALLYVLLIRDAVTDAL